MLHIVNALYCLTVRMGKNVGKNMHLAGICFGSVPNFPFYHYFQNVKWFSIISFKKISNCLILNAF